VFRFLQLFHLQQIERETLEKGWKLYRTKNDLISKWDQSKKYHRRLRQMTWYVHLTIAQHVNHRNVERKRSIDSLDPFKNNYPTECTRSVRENCNTRVWFSPHFSSRVSQRRRFSAIYVIRGMRGGLFSFNMSDDSSGSSVVLGRSFDHSRDRDEYLVTSPSMILQRFSDPNHPWDNEIIRSHILGILLAHAVTAALKARPKFKIATTSTTTTTTTTTEELAAEENDNAGSEVRT